MEIRDRLTPGKNPFWEHAEGTLFTAYRDGKPVGRISAQIDHEHLRVHDGKTVGVLQPGALLGTTRFSMGKAEMHPQWLTEAREHEHTPETLEYGISSFVFRAKRPFHPQLLHDAFCGARSSSEYFRDLGVRTGCEISRI
mgnify:CR=1 FL=1